MSSQLAIPSFHIAWVSGGHLSIMQLWGVGSPTMLLGPLGFHTWDSISVSGRVPTEVGLWGPGQLLLPVASTPWAQNGSKYPTPLTPRSSLHWLSLCLYPVTRAVRVLMDPGGPSQLPQCTDEETEA